MKQKILLSLLLLIFGNALGQVKFEEKVNLYDYDSISVNIIYDDFDNDNDLDIMKYGAPNSRNVLLQKNENGNFNASPPTLIATGKNPILSLDLNNDGYPDLLTYQQFDTIGVLYNLQDGTFSDEQNVQTFNGSYSISPMKVDYDGDGFIDLIAINDDQDAYLLRNNQAGGLEPAEFLIPVGTFNYIQKVEDFDNDGDLDFYIWDYNKLKIHVYDQSAGNFTQPITLQATSSLELFGTIDLDENGYKDILYLKNGAVWAKYFDFDIAENQYVVLKDAMVVDNIPFSTTYGTTHSMHIEDEGNGTYAVYAAILTLDGHRNIYKFRAQNNVFSAIETVLSEFEINTHSLYQFRFLDLNNDNNLDFTFTTGSSDNKMILINNDINDPVDKTLCVQQLVLPNDFTVIDMNGDGIEDIQVGTEHGLTYFEKTANNELSEIQHLIGVLTNPNANSYATHYITDFNNDNIGDVIDFIKYSSFVNVYKNLGNDNFESIQSISLPDNFMANDVSFADIDSDGFKDIVLFNIMDSTGNSGFYWVKNNNGVDFGNIQPVVINGVANIETAFFAFDDFNNDNQIDLLVLSYYHNGSQWMSEMILMQNTNGEFSSSSLATFAGDYGRSHVKIKDVDQDGDLDFFIYNINTNQYRPYALLFFKNDGQNNFQSITIENLNIEDLEFFDGDGDGIYEIYAWNYTSDTYTNNIFYYKTTDFLNFTKYPIDSYPAYYTATDPYTRGDLLLYDYNDDGEDDLFIDNYSAYYGLISVYKNISETLGIEEVENENASNNLKVYPNPFVNSVNWLSYGNETYNIQLLSQDGKVILEKTTSENTLDLTTYNSGFYFLVIEEKANGYKSVYKILKK